MAGFGIGFVYGPTVVSDAWIATWAGQFGEKLAASPWQATIGDQTNPHARTFSATIDGEQVTGSYMVHLILVEIECSLATAAKFALWYRTLLPSNLPWALSERPPRDGWWIYVQEDTIAEDIITAFQGRPPWRGPATPEHQAAAQSDLGRIATVLQRAQIDASSLAVAYDPVVDERRARFGGADTSGKPALGHRLYGLSVDPAATVQTWLAVRELAPELGHWPLFAIGGQEEDLIDDLACTEQITDEILAEASTIDVRDWFRARRSECYIDPGPEPPSSGLSVIRPTTAPSAEAQPPSPVGLSTNYDVGRPLLVPATHPWETLAVTRFGGANHCPQPAVQTAIARSWYERFGAYPICVAYDGVEFYVERPPRQRDAIKRLAWEHVLYCQDLDGASDLDWYRRELPKKSTWAFWWD